MKPSRRSCGPRTAGAAQRVFFATALGTWLKLCTAWPNVFFVRFVFISTGGWLRQRFAPGSRLVVPLLHWTAARDS